jgi:hypothetical protein
VNLGISAITTLGISPRRWCSAGPVMQGRASDGQCGRRFSQVPNDPVVSLPYPCHSAQLRKVSAQANQCHESEVGVASPTTSSPPRARARRFIPAASERSQPPTAPPPVASSRHPWQSQLCDSRDLDGARAPGDSSLIATFAVPWASTKDRP